MGASQIRILLADDQSLIRQGLRYILNSQEDMTVVAEAEDGNQVVQAALQTLPDIILMDVQMPGKSGIEATQSIVEQLPDAKVVLLTTFDVTEYVFDGIRAGAVGYLLKDTDGQDLLAQIRLAYRGSAIYHSVNAAEALAKVVSTPEGQELDAGFSLDDPLTERETQVLQLMAYGRKNSEIASALYLTDGTVKTHVHHILQKLSVDDRTQAVVLAIRNGLVD
ncbi:response regulator [Alicyclobacillus sp. ALC3]|uniref:response regulator n=1 Tax=Alicyclobacillus sp. ALC3 TaxID=2796143 RepID=UPI002378D2AF|nr:response regulator transcription factor [Alicyclobacillus sp. ALC3]WDL98406.1 response regulator transcription factor [Alicyclobacillus sp. ALC3]